LSASETGNITGPFDTLGTVEVLWQLDIEF